VQLQISFSNLGIVTHGVPQGSILGPLLFITYINDLSPSLTGTIIFADDISVVITNKNFDDFHTLANSVFFHMSKWFTAYKLAKVWVNKNNNVYNK
jgi:hypothetical protein